MSWFKQKISGSVRQEKFSVISSSPSSVRSGVGPVTEQIRNERGRGTDGRFSANAAAVVDLESQWSSVGPVLESGCSTWQDDDWTAVLRFCNEVLAALESNDPSTYLRLTDFLLSSELLERLVASLSVGSASDDRVEQLRLCLLRTFDLLLSRSSESGLLTERRLTKPLLRLLQLCGGTSGDPVDNHLVAVLHQLCVGITQYPAVLDLLFGGELTGRVDDEVDEDGVPSPEETPSQFLVFSLLVPFVHREGRAAQQARDDLLLIMSLSSALGSISRHIVDSSNFCLVCSHFSKIFAFYTLLYTVEISFISTRKRMRNLLKFFALFSEHFWREGLQFSHFNLFKYNTVQ